MKKIICAVFVIVTTSSFAQELVEYKVIKDEPTEPKNSLNLEFMNMDVNAAYFDNLSFNLGVNGYSKITDNLYVTYALNKSYLVLGRLLDKTFPGNLEINSGVQFFFKENTFKRTVNVVLDSKEETHGSTRYTTTTSIPVPATIKKKLGFEGGANFRRCAFEFEDSEFVLSHTGIGLYSGIVSRKITNVIIYDERYGKSFKSVGADVFFDVLIMPVNTFKQVSSGVKETHKALPFGFRCGYKLFQVEKKEFTGKNFGISGTASVGYRPYQGWNVTAGVGFTILKR
jgi:hypothetical protein